MMFIVALSFGENKKGERTNGGLFERYYLTKFKR